MLVLQCPKASFLLGLPSGQRKVERYVSFTLQSLMCTYFRFRSCVEIQVLLMRSFEHGEIYIKSKISCLL